MPRYFFHVRDGSSYPDLQGIVLPDVTAAKMEAVRFAGDLRGMKPETFLGVWRVDPDRGRRSEPHFLS
jgi:hypothetical protein